MQAYFYFSMQITSQPLQCDHIEKLVAVMWSYSLPPSCLSISYLLFPFRMSALILLLKYMKHKSNRKTTPNLLTLDFKLIWPTSVIIELITIAISQEVTFLWPFWWEHFIFSITQMFTTSTNSCFINTSHLFYYLLY